MDNDGNGFMFGARHDFVNYANQAVIAARYDRIQVVHDSVEVHYLHYYHKMQNVRLVRTVHYGLYVCALYSLRHFVCRRGMNRHYFVAIPNRRRTATFAVLRKSYISPSPRQGS